MQFAGIFHKTSEQMSYALNENELIVNLRTGYDVRRVFIHYGDPFESGILGGNEKWTGKREEICFKKRLRHQLWWTTTLVPKYKRCKYYFELHTEEEVWYYFEDGFLTEEQMQMDGRMQQCFTVPWMNPADINVTPDWVNETVWYQIFPDRFCRGADTKEEAGVTKWRTGTVTNEERFGGNLNGIREKIPYLEGLGITGIYLNPIMKAESNHKYDTTDYTVIDPHFGTEEEFKDLVEEAHQHGIRIMVDAVFNHCGRKFAPWLDVLEKKEKSAYADWFMIHDWETVEKRADTRDGRFYSFAFTDGMPKLNTNNEEVIQYFCKICEDWIRKFDIDGIRFDVGNEVSHRFLKKIREHLKQMKPDLYLLGEIWHDASQWLLGDEYDSVMNYPLMSGIHDFFLDRGMEKEEFEYMVNRCYTMYMQQSNNVMFNLLDSHDTQRLMSRFDDLDLFYQQLAVLFTMPGSACIYYGTEIAMEGGFDPDCRRCMPWQELDSSENQEKIQIMQKLIAMRKQEAACKSLYFHFPNEYEKRRLVEYIKLDQDGNQVMLMTLHSAKGLEFPIVYMTGLEDGLFPSYMTIMSDDPTEVEEERRLCYVGITRAQKELNISAAKTRMIHGETQMNKVSRFVKEIPENLLEVENHSYGSKKSAISFGGKDSSESQGHFDFRANAKAALSRYGSGTTTYGQGNKKVAISGQKGIGSAYATNYGRTPTNYGTGNFAQPNKKVGFGKEFPMDIFDLKKPAKTTTSYSMPSKKAAGAIKPSGQAAGGTGLGYRVGDTVSHVKFGTGQVLAIEDGMRDYMVTVQFEEFGTKKMLAGFAKLKKQ